MPEAYDVDHPAGGRPVVAGLLASVLPARRATRTPVVCGLAEE